MLNKSGEPKVTTQKRISEWNKLAFSARLRKIKHPILGRYYFPGMLSIIGMMIILSTCAHAQQQSSPAEQALGSRLMSEIQRGVMCEAGMISLQAELAKAQARIKELEAKPDAPKN
jgi:hypothetical protein